MRAQLLRFGGEPLAQLLYLGTSGAPLALYAKKGEGPPRRSSSAMARIAAWPGRRTASPISSPERAMRASLAESGRGDQAGESRSALKPAYSPLPPLPKPKP